MYNLVHKIFQTQLRRLLNRTIADIRITERDKFEGVRLKAIVSTPLILTPLIGVPAALSQAIVRICCFYFWNGSLLIPATKT